MRQRSLDEMITYFNQEIDKMDIDRRYKIALLGMVTAIGCTAKQTIEERKSGEWIKMPYHVTECSECGFSLDDWIQGAFYNFCPNCGSDMRGGDDEAERR